MIFFRTGAGAEVPDALHREVTADTDVLTISSSCGTDTVPVGVEAGVQQVVYTDVEFQSSAFKESLADEKVAEVDVVLICSLSADILREDKSSGKCEVKWQDPA